MWYDIEMKLYIEENIIDSSEYDVCSLYTYLS